MKSLSVSEVRCGRVGERRSVPASECSVENVGNGFADGYGCVDCEAERERRARIDGGECGEVSDEMAVDGAPDEKGSYDSPELGPASLAANGFVLCSPLVSYRAGGRQGTRTHDVERGTRRRRPALTERRHHLALLLAELAKELHLLLQELLALLL